MNHRELYEGRSFLTFFDSGVAKGSGAWLAQLNCRSDQWTSAATWLAVHVAKLRCGGSTHLFDSWLQRAEGGPPHTDSLRECLLPYIASENIGTPEHPASAPHLHGFLAEHIWHAVVSQIAFSLDLPCRVEEPSWSVTDAGGDGLAVFRAGSDFAFRLWESKHHSRPDGVHETVNRAGGQIRDNAMRYLARYSKIGQTLPDAHMAAFYGRLVELWNGADQAAGGGVSVCLSESAQSEQAFDGLSLCWGLDDTDQHEGILAKIEDYELFSSEVREVLWKGL